MQSFDVWIWLTVTFSIGDLDQEFNAGDLDHSILGSVNCEISILWVGKKLTKNSS